LRFEKIKYSSLDVAAIKYGQRYSGPGGYMALVMDRSVANFLEQQGAFLCSTWLHAVLVPGGAQRAAYVGTVYIVSRSIYPFFFHIGHPWLQIATVPGYVSIWYQLFLVIMATANARTAQMA